MRLGVHVQRAGGLVKAVEVAQGLGCDTIQIFSRSPRSLRPSTVSEKDARRFKEALLAAGIHPLVIHAPYLLNLASPRPDTHDLSRAALAHDISLARLLGAEYLVFHPGSHLGSGEKEGMARIAAAIVAAWQAASCQADTSPVLLLEMVSGAGTEIGRAFEQQREIMDGAAGVPMGVCLDTCHVFAAGYDVRTRKGIAATLDALDRSIGMSSLAVVHANDSDGLLGSGLDRHAHIGEGRIGEEGFRAILGCRRLAHLPFILETPHRDTADDARNLATLRRLADEAVIW